MKAARNHEKRIKAFIKKHKGEVLLYLFDLVRLDGFYEDELDYYYTVMSLHDGITHESCVMRPILLKGFIPKKDYDSLRRIFDLNLPDICISKNKCKYRIRGCLCSKDKKCKYRKVQRKT